MPATGCTGQRAGDLPPVFDLECMDDGTGRCSSYGTVGDAKAWLDGVEAAFGRTPITCTQKSFLYGRLGSTSAFARYPLQTECAGRARCRMSEDRFPRCP